MRYFKGLAFLAGAFLLFWIVRRLGTQELVRGFRVLGWRLFIPVLIIFPCYLLYTLSWRLFLRRFNRHSISFWTLFRLKVAGEAANTLTPLNFAGGDPMRIWLLSKYIPVQISGASVVVDRTLQILATVTLILLGNLAALFKLQFSLSVRLLLGATAAFLFVFVIFFLFYQTRGLFEKILKVIYKLKIRSFSEETLHKVKELDAHIGDFYRQDPGLFFRCYLLHFIARLIGITEIFFIARFLGVPMTPWGAVFFAAVIPVTILLGGIVPGTLGILEGVLSSLFLALHWNPADAIVLQMARRIRAFIWIVIGLVFLVLFKGTQEKDI